MMLSDVYIDGLLTIQHEAARPFYVLFAFKHKTFPLSTTSCLMSLWPRMRGSQQNAPSITEMNSLTFCPALRGKGLSEGGESPLTALQKADIMPHSSG